MKSQQWQIVGIFILAVLLVLGCKKTGSTNNGNTGVANPPVETPVEKVKPNPGTGNVQGKVFFNSKPVENIEVKLCEKFSRFVSGYGGQTLKAKTDKDGDYVITDVKPGTYEALMAKVFDTDMYVFATTGLAGISAAKYEEEQRYVMIQETIHHWIHHRGQMTVYLRLMGAPVPAIYGPSADENSFS